MVETKLLNRSDTSIAIVLPQRHFRLELAPKQSGYMPHDYLVEFASSRGGRKLIYDYVMIENIEDLKKVLNIEQEVPEYWLTEENLPNWMQNCSLAEFQDGLDFAPEGVKELIKKFAVTLPLNDVAKREAIKSQLDFDVTVAIANSAEEIEAAANAAANAPKRRSETSTVAQPQATPRKYVEV